MIPTLHVRLLGEFLLLSDETPVTSVDLPRLQSLLAYLVLHHGTPQSRSRLAYLFWPDTTDAQALSNLRTVVHRLRQALPNADSFLQVGRQSLQWQPRSAEAPWALDVQNFEDALVGAEQAEQTQDVMQTRQALGQAVSLYRGDLLLSCSAYHSPAASFPLESHCTGATCCSVVTMSGSCPSVTVCDRHFYVPWND